MPTRVVTAMSRRQVRDFDAWAIRVLGVPGIVLMENAGRGCAEFIMGRIASASMSPSRVLVVCGTGNNGGDGYVIARHLANEGIGLRVLLCGDRGRVAGDALTNLQILENRGIAIERLHPGDLSKLSEHGQGASLLVDALFGTGLRGGLDAQWSALIEALNALRLPTVAIDIPSGLDCDTGDPLSAAIRADWTVSLVALKQGYLNPNAWAYTGAIHITGIGVGAQAFEAGFKSEASRPRQ